MSETKADQADVQSQPQGDQSPELKCNDKEVASPRSYRPPQRFRYRERNGALYQVPLELVRKGIMQRAETPTPDDDISDQDKVEVDYYTSMQQTISSEIKEARTTDKPPPAVRSRWNKKTSLSN